MFLIDKILLNTVSSYRTHLNRTDTNLLNVSTEDTEMPQLHSTFS